GTAVINTSLSCGTCTNPIYYFWTPGNLVGTTQSVTPNVTTIYTANAFNGTCTATQTLTVTISAPSLSLSVSQSTICLGNSATLSASGTYTSGVWQPGSLASPLVVSPTVS